MEISKIFVPKKYPFTKVWKKQKKSIIVVLSLSGLAGLGFTILWYLFSEKNYFSDLKLKSLNIIDFYLVLVGGIFVILIIILILIPFVLKPFFLIICNVYKKNKYYYYLLELLDSEPKSNCIVNIPRLNITTRGPYNIDFHNKTKILKEASFQVNKIEGNNWRIGMKLLDINGNNEIFVFHPYIDNKDQHYLSFRLLNKEKNNEIDKSFNDYIINIQT